MDGGGEGEGLRSAAVALQLGWLTLSHCMWGPLALGPAGSDPMSAAPTSADPVPREREEDDDRRDWWEE